VTRFRADLMIVSSPEGIDAPSVFSIAATKSVALPEGTATNPIETLAEVELIWVIVPLKAVTVRA